jgi:hypothetical protein
LTSLDIRDRTMNDPHGDDAASAVLLHQEEICALLDEIARLESELRARDEALASAGHYDSHTDAADSDGGPADPTRAEELSAELAAREETIAVLLEQTRWYEEAAAAQKSEWEQLHQWVEEVERRVAEKESREADLRAELNEERRKGEASRSEAESLRRQDEVSRRGLEREVESLRDRLRRAAEGQPRDALVASLEEENRRLQRLRLEAERAGVAAAQVEELTRCLASARSDLNAARAEARRLADERDRERNEYEAQVLSLRSQLAVAPEGPAEPGENEEQPEPSESASRSALEIDERIRAFRLHLRELHETEAQEKARHSLAARLSRLWRHTGPA